MTDFDRGRMKALLDAVTRSIAVVDERKSALRCHSPCGLTSLEYAELLGMAMCGLDRARKLIEQMTSDPTP